MVRPSRPYLRVVRFREKPDAELAETFLAQGNFRWNAGMFIWTVHAILGAFNRYAPALGEFIGRIHSRGDFAALLRDAFPALPKISIDYAIMEKATRVLVVEAGFDWDDVGGWTAVAKYLASDEAGNQSNCSVKSLEAANNIVFTDQPKTVALLGVSDLIVVHTGRCDSRVSPLRGGENQTAHRAHPPRTAMKNWPQR